MSKLGFAARSCRGVQNPSLGEALGRSPMVHLRGIWQGDKLGHRYLCRAMNVQRSLSPSPGTLGRGFMVSQARRPQCTSIRGALAWIMPVHSAHRRLKYTRRVKYLLIFSVFFPFASLFRLVIIVEQAQEDGENSEAAGLAASCLYRGYPRSRHWHSSGDFWNGPEYCGVLLPCG